MSNFGKASIRRVNALKVGQKVDRIQFVIKEELPLALPLGSIQGSMIGLRPSVAGSVLVTNEVFTGLISGLLPVVNGNLLNTTIPIAGTVTIGAVLTGQLLNTTQAVAGQVSAALPQINANLNMPITGQVFGLLPAVNGQAVNTTVAVVGAVSGLLPSISGLFQQPVAGGISGIVSGLLPNVNGSVATTTQNVTGSISGLLPSVNGAVSNTTASMVGSIGGALPAINGTAVNTTVSLPGSIGGLPPAINGVLTAPSANAISGSIAGLLPDINGTAVNTTVSIAGSISGLLPAVNGSTVNTTVSVAGSINGLTPSVNGSFTAPAATAISGAINGLTPSVNGTAVNTTVTVPGSISGLLSVVNGTLQNTTATVPGSIVGLVPTVNGSFAASGGADEAEVTAWISRVTTAGGTVSNATKTAMNTFVAGCKADGIWAKLSAGLVLPFASDNFNGALEPLAIPTGETITNNNFTSSDYSLTTGLDPGSANANKALTTSILGAFYSLTNHQMSYYCPVYRNTGITSPIASVRSSNTAVVALFDGSATNQVEFRTAANTTNILTVNTQSGLLTGCRRSTTDAEVYRNGVSIGTRNTGGGAIAVTQPIRLFIIQTNYGRQIMSYFYTGAALTSAEEANHYSRVHALQTALGRAHS